MLSYACNLQVPSRCYCVEWKLTKKIKCISWLFFFFFTADLVGGKALAFHKVGDLTELSSSIRNMSHMIDFLFLVV